MLKPHTQIELKEMQITIGKEYKIRYINKDYFNAQESLEIGKATAIESNGNIYFNVIDPYGMDKLVMQAEVIG
jgi:hypothetical protein